ncbi:MAG: ABC transporter ATP-binding protein [Bacilli bacterium]
MIKAKKKRGVFSCLKFIYHQAWKCDKSYIFVVIFNAIFNVAASLPLLFIPYIAIRFLQDSKNYLYYSLWLVGLLTAFIILSIISIYFSTKAPWSGTFLRLRRFFHLMYEKSLTCDYEVYESNELKQEKEKAESALYGNWRGVELMFKGSIASLVGILGLIVYLATSGFGSYLILIILVVATALSIGASFFSSLLYQKRVGKIAKPQSVMEYLYNTTKNSSAGKDIRNYSLANIFHVLFVKNVSLFEKYNHFQNHVLILPNLSNCVFGFLRDFLGYFVLVEAVISGQIDIASFALYISILNGLSTYCSSINNGISQLLNGSKETALFIDYIEKPSSFSQTGYDLKELPNVLSIDFEDVSFTYPGMDKPTLEHLTFHIKPGEKIALVGENGAGKSTIIKLLSLLYKPTSGKILVGGVDITSFNSEEYRTLLSVINQEVNLLAYPLDQVISCSLYPDEQKLQKCLKEAGISEKIASLPQKEHSFISQNISDKGIDFSGGETQKILMARALYRDGKLLLLDEPTSALDPIAEGQIYEQYQSIAQNKTSIFISHRLASTRFCDRIIYLKNGHVQEEGTHESLLTLGKEYANMFAIQASYYQEDN